MIDIGMRSLRAGMLAMLLAGAVALPAQDRTTAGASASRAHSLDRLYSYPRLIGTAPTGYSWSPDGERLAFLWNDEGGEFRDVWITSTADPRPQRLTRLPQPEIATPSPGDTEAILQLHDAERDAGVSTLLWHPDGRRLLFVFRGELFALLPGEQPSRIAFARGALSQLDISPDRRWVSFLRAGRVWRGQLLGDSLDAAPAGPEPGADIGIQSYRWSPDARRIAVVQFDRSDVPVRKIPDYLREEPALQEIARPYPGEEPGRRRLGVLDPATGGMRWVALDADERDLIFSYAWSPDGGTIAVDRSDLFVNDRRVLLVDAATGNARRILRELDTLNVTAQWQLEWAPDGRGLFFLSDRDEDYHIYYLSTRGGAPVRITRGDWAVFSFHVSAPAHAIFLVGNRDRREERHIYRVALNGGAVTRLSESAGNHAPVFSPDGRYAAVRYSSDTVPPDLFLTRLEAGAPAPRERRVTESPLAEFTAYRWQGARYVTFPSHADGAPLQGRLLLPHDFDPARRYPAVLGSVYSNTVLNQWGGRSAHPNWGIDQYLLQEGFVILQVDVRGSAGHGRAHRRGIRLDYGGIDVEDLHSAVQYLGTLGYVDTSRVGLWGSSYGGLLTAMSLFRKPGVYRAGIAAAPATNVRHALTGEMRVMESPERRPAAYDSASAVTFAAGLQDRLLLLHGMRDWIVLFHDSMTLLHHLILMEKPVDIVVLPDAQHAWTQEGSSQVRFAYGKVAEYLIRHVRDAPLRERAAP
jgi:dipeptidyl-peptidase 4